MSFLLGEKIKILREQAGLSQKEFAKSLGISAARLCNWENGHNGCPVDYIPSIAAQLGVSVDSLLGVDFSADGADDLIFYYVTLNDDGKAAVMKYAADLCEIPKYQKGAKK